MSACCRHVLCYGKYAGPGPPTHLPHLPASLEFIAMAAPDHTYCHFYGFRLRIPTVAAKLPIIETFNKQAKKYNAFVWFGTTVETL